MRDRRLGVLHEVGDEVWVVALVPMPWWERAGRWMLSLPPRAEWQQLQGAPPPHKGDSGWPHLDTQHKPPTWCSMDDVDTGD